ncbi:hypothetical protein BDW22DRAFT_1363173 [Trametopsis cervina]|nr:hypothetical protein BDW22DRAFT_1363173 [Trametopsis cervina]
MPRYQVFVGAPTLKDLRDYLKSDKEEPHGRKWRIIETSGPSQGTRTLSSGSGIYSLPPATLEEASRRISRLYENIIFGGIEDPEEDIAAYNPSGQHVREQDSTLITWPPTLPNDSRGGHTADRHEITFLRPTGSFTRSRIAETQLGNTPESQETDSYSLSYKNSSDTSVARFPSFHFSLHSLASLALLRKRPRATHKFGPGGSPSDSKQKVNVLAAVLETEGPDTIRIKRGPDAGKEVSLLKMIIGDEDGEVCRLTAWREVAEHWGGTSLTGTAIKRGDIVYLQNLLAATDATSSTQSTLSLTASPALNSSMLICYRTMPRAPDRDIGVNDERFRPDLRLGNSDATVRKVAAVVRWFENTAGLPQSR